MGAHYDHVTGPTDACYTLGPRIGYEQTVRMDLLSEIHAAVADEVLALQDSCQEQESNAQVVIIALVPVHIANKARLDRFKHVLKSIARQQPLPNDAEFIVAFSWYAATPALAAETEHVFEGLSCSRGHDTREGPKKIVVVRQQKRYTQFQHLRAALDEAQAVLGEGCDKQKRSMWTMFGDDDDLWHSNRIAETVRAITSHQTLPGVGIFATMTRVNIFSSDIAANKIPATEEEVDVDLEDKRVTLNAETPFNKEWSQQLHDVGGQAWKLQVPHLDLEYFDLCPRLRILREFFEVTSETILGHRLCDLRFRDYLLYYPLMGRELGLEVVYFQPQCWMYFYANPMPNEEEWMQAIEGQDEKVVQTKHVGLTDGHVSSEVLVESTERQWADKYIGELSSFDPDMTKDKLMRYLAHFRYRMENFLVRSHGYTFDQRDFDNMIVEAIKCSFFPYLEKMQQYDQKAADEAGNFLCCVCQSYAKQEMIDGLGVKVRWLNEQMFIPNCVAIE